MAKLSKITDPKLAEQVAQLVLDGHSNAEVAAAIGEGTHPDTIKTWKKRPEVQAHLTRMREERINAIDSKITSRLWGILNNKTELESLDIKTLLEIRKELLPPPAQRIIASRGVDEGTALADLYMRLSQNPELAAALGLGAIAELEAGEEVEDDEPV